MPIGKTGIGGAAEPSRRFDEILVLAVETPLVDDAEIVHRQRKARRGGGLVEL